MTDVQQADARSWLPEILATDTAAAALLDEDYDRLGSFYGVILERLRVKLATLLNSPTSFSLPGEYSESNGERVQALERLILRAERALAIELAEAGQGGTHGRLVRYGRPHGRP